VEYCNRDLPRYHGFRYRLFRQLIAAIEAARGMVRQAADLAVAATG
jgi:hypothetical protein